MGKTNLIGRALVNDSVYERRSMSPLHLKNVFNDIENRSSSLQKAKNEITELDRHYRSRKDLLRSELYTGIKRLFQIYPSNYRMLLDITDERYENFLKPKPEFEKLKSWDFKHKVQRVLRYVESQNSENRPMLYSLAGSLNIVYAAKNPNKHHWTTYRLLDGNASTNSSASGDKHSLRTLGTAVKSKIASTLQVLENESGGKWTDVQDLYYVHRKLVEDYIFIGVRKQVSPVPENLKSSRKNKENRRKIIKETAETLTIMFTQNLSHFFTSGSISANDTVLKALVEALGYKRYKKQNLEGNDLAQLVQTCKEEHAAASLDDVEEQFRTEESELAAKGIFYGCPKAELNQRYQIATFLGTRAQNLDAAETSKKKKPLTETLCFTSSLGKCTWKIKGTAADVDKHIVESYERGIITDLTPFINLKKQQANQCHLEE